MCRIPSGASDPPVQYREMLSNQGDARLFIFSIIHNISFAAYYARFFKISPDRVICEHLTRLIPSLRGASPCVFVSVVGVQDEEAFDRVNAVAGMTASAQAGRLNFDFSFTGTFGNQIGGTVTGEIFGLTDNATGPASAVDIYSVPGSVVYGETLPFNTMTAENGTVNSNSFTVVNGEITVADFSAGVDLPFPGADWLLQLENIPNSFYDMGSREVGGNEALLVKTFTATFTPDVATTPLPSTWFLLLSGFVGIGCFAYCRPNKNAAAVAAA
jgi:hypothetical protein